MKSRFPQELYAESIGKKKNLLHFAELLSNGQVLHVWIYSYKGESKEYGAGMFIGNCDKDARFWFMGKREFDISGDGSIEGILKGVKILSEVSSKLPEDHVLWIYGEDERRTQLYNKLIKRERIKEVKEGHTNGCIIRYFEEED